MFCITTLATTSNMPITTITAIKYEPSTRYRLERLEPGPRAGAFWAAPAPGALARRPRRPPGGSQDFASQDFDICLHHLSGSFAENRRDLRD